MRKLLPALGFAMWLAGCGGAVAQGRQDSNSKQPTMTLWQAIDEAAAQFPLSQAKVAAVLGMPMHEVRRNPYTIFLRNDHPIPLSEGSQIAEVDLRLGLAPGDPGFIVLGLDDGCMTLHAVRTHYNDLKITDTPRGRSLDEVTAYSVSLPWGRLSFSFKERNRQCLASVAFDPKEGQTQARSE